VRRHSDLRLLVAPFAALALLLAACGSQNGHGADPGSGHPGPSKAARPPSAVTGDGPDCHTPRSHLVSSSIALADALATARPGETIMLAPGIYQNDFETSASGTPSEPITLCGSRQAVLLGVSLQRGYVLHLKQASWWRLEGFTITGGQKGVVADGATHDLLFGLYVHSIGDEAIHLRSFSSDNTVSHCVIRQAGLLVQFFGEGIYVGSAHSNWCRYTNCRPDRSDNNKLIDNNIADTAAENIDIKEGTTGGQIIGNRLNGTGMVASAATAWVNVKGNNWTIDGNVGLNSVGDGFQVHQVQQGWGVGNVFLDNRAQLNGPGYAIYVQSRRLGTVVACSNIAKAARRGLSTISCSKS
jgi:predicted small secreted protein